MLLLHTGDTTPDRVRLDRFRADASEPFSGVRCPLCAWRPGGSSVWLCDCHGTPEPRFVSCGTRWNTFATHGQCPGCSHQWQWTTCLRCFQASRHDDWYEDDRGDLP